MKSYDQTAILAQQKALEAGQPELSVLRPCKVGDGILSHSDEEKEVFRLRATNFTDQIHFFIPASGSGSRMFAFLEAFLEQQNFELTDMVERFLSRLPELALFRSLAPSTQEAYHKGSLSAEALIKEILSEKGLNYSFAPKALIPFHIHEPFVLNAFDEHLAQAEGITNGKFSFHFTIQEEYRNAFESRIKYLSQLTAQNYEVTFSSQDKATDAFVFDQSLQLIQDAAGEPLRRPAGHGTLLQNLSAIGAQYLLVRNIDNVQHFTHKQENKELWKYLLGLQIEVRERLRHFEENKDLHGFLRWNQKWQLIDAAFLCGITTEEWLQLINRPLRVCGMVRNNGQPGGGPFILEFNGKPTKQIIEKMQLSNHPNVGQLLLQSSYFNPVLMVLSPCDLHNQPHDLSQFADPKSYLIVEKQRNGKPVRFIEQPGLWNGGMAHWLTLFVEVPDTTFTPVKTVLDLLDFAHQANKGA